MTPTDPILYNAVKLEANKKFLAPTSVYKSAWIIKNYKDRGGTFTDSRNPDQGLIRWFNEKWVDTTRGNRPCGRPIASLNGVYPLCRPTIRVTKDTPRLLSEIPETTLHKAQQLKQIVKYTKHISYTK